MELWFSLGFFHRLQKKLIFGIGLDRKKMAEAISFHFIEKGAIYEYKDL